MTSLTTHQPDKDACLNDWIDWFWNLFLPAWVECTCDDNGPGFHDALDVSAKPINENRKTLLVQARLLFTFSHLAVISGDATYRKAAQHAKDALSAFRKESGGYCKARTLTGEPTDIAEDEYASSYDQSFVILSLCTWRQLVADNQIDIELEACWTVIENQLTDASTGLLLEHDNIDNPAAPTAPYRAQNPHMHMFEAALQAYALTGDEIWATRAALMRTKGLEYFFDQKSGTIREFRSADLSPLNNKDGQRREPGHQFEWAWLLYREAELTGHTSTIAVADRLLKFAEDHGTATSGAMAGAAFDAVSANLDWYENTFLLWPQTEAIKALAIRKDNTSSQRAQNLTLLMFQAYFMERSAFINQVDSLGNVIWPEALSRLLYHVVLALTEGARAGLWK